MPLDSYESLQESVANWVMRDDLAPMVPDFIAFAESELNTRLRTSEMLVRSRANILEQYTEKPADWLEAWNIQIVGGAPLEYATPAAMDRLKADPTPVFDHTPRYFTILGDSIEVYPLPGDPVELEMIYYARIPQLSDDQPTNWLLDRAPQIYLYGALVHTAPFLAEDERVTTWQGQFDRYVQELNQADGRSRRSGAPLQRPKPGGL